MLNHASVTTSTNASKAITLPTGAGLVRVILQNNDATNDIYIGAKNVTASGSNAGIKIAKGTTYEFTLDGGDTIYAVSNAGTPALTIAWTRN